MQGTYMGIEKQTGRQTQGGYSSVIVVDQYYVLRILDGMDAAKAAPLLCAGITLYSPLRHWNAGPGKTVGIVGLGGLGHMGVKLAHAMGAKVVLFTTHPGKVADGKKLGADDVVISKNEKEMERYTRKLDLIVNTVSVAHDLDAFINLLKRDGTMVLVGAPATPHPSPQNLQPSHATPFHRWLRHWRNQRDAGDARLLREKQCPAGNRDDFHPGYQQSLGAGNKERREISFRHRHGDVEGGEASGVRGAEAHAPDDGWMEC